MDEMKEKKVEAGEEFNILWDKIKDEAQVAFKGAPNDINWHMISIMFMRGLLLSSSSSAEQSSAAHDLLSTIPNMTLLFGALRDTPLYLQVQGESVIPAWKHSANACLDNMLNPETRGNDVYPPYLVTHPLDQSITKLITKNMITLGFHHGALIPMPGAGKIGITTMIKMWLNDFYPLPLTHKKYKAHGLSLDPAVAVMHDVAHRELDNRTFEVSQAVLNRLKQAASAGKSVRGCAKLAAIHMVERYRQFNAILLAYVEEKERILIVDLRKTQHLAEEARKIAELEPKRCYNIGVAALFEVFHEQYAFNAKVLEAETFADAMIRLCGTEEAMSPLHVAEGASVAGGGEIPELDKRKTAKFNELRTYFNPSSDLTDREIVEVIMDRTLASVGIYPAQGTQSAALAPITLRDYRKNIDEETISIYKGDVYTQISFDVLSTGEAVEIKVPTTRFLVETAKDENAVLRLTGQDVAETALEAETLKSSEKSETERQVEVWYGKVKDGTRRMVAGLRNDVLQHAPHEAMLYYDRLVCSQNAQWAAKLAPDGVLAPSMTTPVFTTVITPLTVLAPSAGEEYATAP